MKKIFTIIFLMFFSFNAFSYFENRYRCSVQSEKIIVWLKKTKNSVKCLNILKNIYIKQQKIKKAINYAYQNYKVYNNIYWYNLYQKLLKDSQKYESLRNEIVRSIEIFEKSLFEKVKRVVDLWLQKEYKILTWKYNIFQTYLKENFYSWNLEKFIYYRNKLDKVVYKIFLLNNIKKAQSFEQMIPLLKKYVNLWN